jgi:hypothetical protein
MQFQQSVNNVFIQLRAAIEQLSPDQYSRPCKTLFNNTIGQHVRHIIEMFQCLDTGYSSGRINYERRKRDQEIETDRELADRLLLDIYGKLGKPDKELLLEVNFDEHSGEPVVIPSNYLREIAYNLEHTIHHMAMIRVGIAEVASLSIPENFGVAHSTIKHRRQCAQ